MTNENTLCALVVEFAVADPDGYFLRFSEGIGWRTP